MQLDIQNGDVYFGEKLTISLKTTISQMAKSYPDTVITDKQTGYFWLDFADIRIDDNIWQVSACYFHEELKRIHLYFRHWTQKPFSWDDWIEASELALKKRYEKWIADNIGEQTQFAWGNIGAYYNPKDGLAVMIVNYHGE